MSGFAANERWTRKNDEGHGQKYEQIAIAGKGPRICCRFRLTRFDSYKPSKDAGLPNLTRFRFPNSGFLPLGLPVGG